MLSDYVAIADLKYLSQLNYTAHFDDLKQKNLYRNLVGDFTKKLVTGMDVAPNLIRFQVIENFHQKFEFGNFLVTGDVYRLTLFCYCCIIICKYLYVRPKFYSTSRMDLTSLCIM